VLADHLLSTVATLFLLLVKEVVKDLVADLLATEVLTLIDPLILHLLLELVPVSSLLAHLLFFL